MAHFSQRQQYSISDNAFTSNIQWTYPFAQTQSNNSLDGASTYTSPNDQGFRYTSGTAIQAHRSLSISSDSSSVSHVDLDPHAIPESEVRDNEGTTSNRRRRSSVLVEIEADQEPQTKKKRGKNKASAYIASNLAYIKGTSHTSRYPLPAWFNVPEGKTVIHPPPFAFPAPQLQPISTAPPVLKRDPAPDVFAPPIPPSLSAAPRKGSIGKKATKRASLPFDSDETKEKVPAPTVSARKASQRAASLERRHSVHTSSNLRNETSDLFLGDQPVGVLPRTDSPSLWFTPATPTVPMPIFSSAPTDATANPHTSYKGYTTNFLPNTLPSDPTSVLPLNPNFLAQALSSSMSPACPNTTQPAGQPLLPITVQDFGPPLPTQWCTLSCEPAPVCSLPSATALASTSNTSLQVSPTSQAPQMNGSRLPSPLVRRWSSPNIQLAALPTATPVVTMTEEPYRTAAFQPAQRAVSQQTSGTEMPPPPLPCPAPSLEVDHGPMISETAVLWRDEQGNLIPPVAGTKKIPPPLFTSDPLPLASSRVSAAEMALGLDPSAFRPVVFDGSWLFGSSGVNDPFLAAFGTPFFPVASDQPAPVDFNITKAEPIKDSTIFAPRAIPILSPYTESQAKPIGKSSTQAYKGRPRSTTPLYSLEFPQYGEHYNIYQGQ